MKMRLTNRLALLLAGTPYTGLTAVRQKTGLTCNLLSSCLVDGKATSCGADSEGNVIYVSNNNQLWRIKAYQTKSQLLIPSKFSVCDPSKGWPSLIGEGELTSVQLIPEGPSTLGGPYISLGGKNSRGTIEFHIVNTLTGEASLQFSSQEAF